MKLKIISASEASENNKRLDDMVNEFCENVNVVDIRCETVRKEIYCYIKYMSETKGSSGLERLVENTNYCSKQDVSIDSER